MWNRRITAMVTVCDMISMVNKVSWVKLVLYLNRISRPKTLLTHSTIIFDFQCFASFIVAAHQKSSSVNSSSGSTGWSSKWQELKSAAVQSPCGGMPVKNNYHGLWPTEVPWGFTNLKIYFFVRKVFSKGQPWGSTEWRLVYPFQFHWSI